MYKLQTRKACNYQVQTTSLIRKVFNTRSADKIAIFLE